MKVSATTPFKIIYSLFQHEFLGLLFESFVVALDAKGRLSFAHQNISSKNATEFSSGLDEIDFELIKTMDAMQPDNLIKHFSKKKINANDFYLKVFDPNKGDKTLQKEIIHYLERKRAKILPLLCDKMVFEMGKDGEPAWKKINVLKDKASVLFHFRKNEDNTHYFPTLKLNEEKLQFQYKGAYIVNDKPAWMLVENKLFAFEQDIDGKKLSPFLNKKFIVIPKKVEQAYYEKFVTSLIASSNVYAKGFDIITIKNTPYAKLIFSEFAATSTNLFSKEDDTLPTIKIFFELAFYYGNYPIKPSSNSTKEVFLEKKEGKYTFYKITRDKKNEKNIITLLKKHGLSLKDGKILLPQQEAMTWIAENINFLEKNNIYLSQKKSAKKYWIGKPNISLKINENIDWFDIHATIQFGTYNIPFLKLREYILQKKTDFLLPNGEVAVIPKQWLEDYAHLLTFSNVNDNQGVILKKHHLGVINTLEANNTQNTSIQVKLQKLKDFKAIDKTNLPNTFQGELRPYQKAGYDWLHFLSRNSFGGCLADDMGLGKTIQTLAMLASIHDEKQTTSLLIMPTSLIYNWEMEAKRFTPDLKILSYVGPNREKDPTHFSEYDLIVTSYGIVRLDIDILKNYFFNYIILDESQVIKNPQAIIAKAVNQLKSKSKLALTGTPIENSTLDLWSQMNFLNPGLLGSANFFKKEFQIPIEKKSDSSKRDKLYSIIKPFIMRREKSQVAKELPEKVEKIHYCEMSLEQEEFYEKTKSHYRNTILNKISENGLGKAQILLLQGLTKLRQIANHPYMVDKNYTASSGKLDDALYMINNAIRKNHKILIFSQFVKHLAIFKTKLSKQNIAYTYLDGTTKNRKSEVERFQKEENIHIFLISLKAGGLGLNLTSADYVFLLDPWWNPAIEAQAVDRAHRIGQKNKVFIYKFITKNTIEEKIILLQKSKLKLANDLITTEESFIKTLSSSDIEKLLS